MCRGDEDEEEDEEETNTCISIPGIIATHYDTRHTHTEVSPW